jgi:hypothetical protein
MYGFHVIHKANSNYFRKIINKLAFSVEKCCFR